MKQPAIIIGTSIGNIIAKVKSFKYEDVRSVLGKHFDVEEMEIILIGGDVHTLIVGIKNPSPAAKELFTRTVKFMTNEWDVYFVVEYGAISNIK